MRVPAIPFSTWTRAQGYPIFNRNDGVFSCQDRLYVRSESFDYSDLIEVENLEFEGQYPTQIQAVPDPSGKIMNISYTFTRASADGESQAYDGRPEYTLEDGSLQVPIDMKDENQFYARPNFKIHWIYYLVGKKEIDWRSSSLGGVVTPEMLTWWETATEVTDAFLEAFNGKDKKMFWVKENDSIPTGYKILKFKKKNIEYFIYPSPTVVEVRKYMSYSTAVKNISRVGYIKTPKKTFGYEGMWLIVGSSCSHDGRRWRVTTRYQWALKWDKDIYLEA
jgi:hypothetical protein